MNSLKSDFCIFVKETIEEIIKLYTSKVRKTIFFNCVIDNGFNGESLNDWWHEAERPFL